MDAPEEIFGTSRSKAVRAVLTAVGASLLTVGFCYLAVDFAVKGPLFNPLRRRPFASPEWRSAEPESRGSMVPSLIQSGVLIGKGPDTVVELLGPPDSILLSWKEKGTEQVAVNKTDGREYDEALQGSVREGAGAFSRNLRAYTYAIGRMGCRGGILSYDRTLFVEFNAARRAASCRID